jgi:hypothetical protein
MALDDSSLVVGDGSGSSLFAGDGPAEGRELQFLPCVFSSCRGIKSVFTHIMACVFSSCRGIKSVFTSYHGMCVFLMSWD